MILIFYQERHVGDVEGDTYYTHRHAKPHYFVVGRGYPINTAVLTRLHDLGVTRIVIIEHRANHAIRHFISALTAWTTAPISDH